MKKYDEENSFHIKYTKSLMIISAIFLVVNGFVLSCFPNEYISGLLTISWRSHLFILFLQILGALYLEDLLATIIWMSNNTYNRWNL